MEGTTARPQSNLEILELSHMGWLSSLLTLPRIVLRHNNVLKQVIETAAVLI